MRGRSITKEARVVQLARSAAVSEVDSSVRMAIKSLQAQLQALHAKVNEMVTKSTTSFDEKGQVDTGGEPSRTLLRLINNSGQDVEMGDVVLIDSGLERSFTLGTEAGSHLVAGVVASDSLDGDLPAISDGDEGLICTGGVAYVNADATGVAIVVGDPLETGPYESTAVKAVANSTGIFATALEELPSGTGLIRAAIRVESLAHAEAVKELQQFDYSLFERGGYFVAGYDDDGSATGFSGVVTGAAVWANSSMSQLIGNWTYGYNLSGMIVSSIHSAYNQDGTLQCTVSRSFQYQQDRIDKILSEIS